MIRHLLEVTIELNVLDLKDVGIWGRGAHLHSAKRVPLRMFFALFRGSSKTNFTVFFYKRFVTNYSLKHITSLKADYLPSQFCVAFEIQR